MEAVAFFMGNSLIYWCLSSWAPEIVSMVFESKQVQNNNNEMQSFMLKMLSIWFSTLWNFSNEKKKTETVHLSLIEKKACKKKNTSNTIGSVCNFALWHILSAYPLQMKSKHDDSQTNQSIYVQCSSSSSSHMQIKARTYQCTRDLNE